MDNSVLICTVFGVKCRRCTLCAVSSRSRNGCANRPSICATDQSCRGAPLLIVITLGPWGLGRGAGDVPDRADRCQPASILSGDIWSFFEQKIGGMIRGFSLH